MTDEKKDVAEATEEKKVEATETAEVVEEKTEETPVEEVAPAKTEEATPEAGAGEEVEIPKEFEKLIEQVESMTVLELNKLVKVLEKKFGVSAAAVAVAGPAAGGAEAEEKSEFDVELTSIGDSKIGVIKALKAALGLGLKEAKDLTEAAPEILKTGMKKDEAEALKKAIEEAGGSVTLK